MKTASTVIHGKASELRNEFNKVVGLHSNLHRMFSSLGRPDGRTEVGCNATIVDNATSFNRGKVSFASISAIVSCGLRLQMS